MTIQSNTSRVTYIGDNVSTVFTVPFLFFANVDITVVKTAVGGGVTTLTLNVDYTLTGATLPAGGALTKTTALLTGETLGIFLDPPRTQLSHYLTNDIFPAATLETNLDREVQISQRLYDLISRSIRAPDSDNNPQLILPSAISRALKYPTFDVNGNLSMAVSVPSGTLSQTSIGSFLYPQTSAEAAAAVTPTNYFYPELDVKRYGATGDGVTNDAPAFTNAGLVARVNGGEVYVSKPTVQYLLTSTVNWTNGNTVTPQHGFVVRGCAGGYDNATSAHILIKHNSTIAFDCAGTNSIRFLNLVIATDAVTYPGVIFFRARNSVGNSQVYRFTNVMFAGSASIAVDYNYGSEQDVHIGCLWYNNATDANAKVSIITSNNIRALTSSFITIATGNRSCITHRYYGGDYFMNSTTATADVFEFDNVLEVFMHGTWLDCRARSYIYVNPTNGTSSLIHIDQVEGENSAPLPTYGIYFGPAGATQTPTGWMIKDSYIPSVTRAIFADTNIVLDNFYIDNIQENASHGLQATTLQNSIIDSTGFQLNLTFSKQNNLTGDSSGWTITARQNDYWNDTGATNKSWTANVTALTITGALTRNEQHCVAHGSLVTVTVTITAATSIVCAAGVAITGLPFPVSNRSALVSVCNETTHVAIGTGMVDTDGKIYLPAINVGAAVAVTITATYFAA